MKIDLTKLRDLREFRIPMDMALNDLTASLLARKLREKGYDITPAQLRSLFREVRRYRREHPEWVPVEIETEGKVTVRLLF